MDRDATQVREGEFVGLRFPDHRVHLFAADGIRIEPATGALGTRLESGAVTP